MRDTGYGEFQFPAHTFLADARLLPSFQPFVHRPAAIQESAAAHTGAQPQIAVFVGLCKLLRLFLQLSVITPQPKD